MTWHAQFGLALALSGRRFDADLWPEPTLTHASADYMGLVGLRPLSSLRIYARPTVEVEALPAAVGGKRALIEGPLPERSAVDGARARMRQNRKFNVDRANLLLGGNPDLREIALKAPY